MLALHILTKEKSFPHQIFQTIFGKENVVYFERTSQIHPEEKNEKRVSLQDTG